VFHLKALPRISAGQTGNMHVYPRSRQGIGRQIYEPSDFRFFKRYRCPCALT
jgi:hypothetical protein